MKITINSIEQLYELDRALFNQVKQFLGITHNKHIYRLNVAADLPIAFAEAVKRFQEKNSFEIWDEARKQELKAANDKEGADRATWWITQGLLPSDHNLELIHSFLREKAEGFLCAANVDAAVEFYRAELQWKPKPTAPPVVVAPSEPPPPPVLIDDPESPTGKSEQLSLDTTPCQRHTKAQLRDWSARTRAEHVKQVRAHNNAVAAEFNKQVEAPAIPEAV